MIFELTHFALDVLAGLEVLSVIGMHAGVPGISLSMPHRGPHEYVRRDEGLVYLSRLEVGDPAGRDALDASFRVISHSDPCVPRT